MLLFEFYITFLPADGMRAAAEMGTFGLSRWQLSKNIFLSSASGPVNLEL
jgi:hypothetical protein